MGLQTLAGWGRFPSLSCCVVAPGDEEAVRQTVKAQDSLIARGNGRAYGDAALNPTATLSMLGQDRLLAFDPTCGILSCQAGVLLADILQVFVPRGWFPPVTPGTKFVTVGGMIATDVHGKNHHRAGSFGQHVISLDLALSDGTVLHCSPEQHPEMFAATCGGMGLTGVILRASFRLIPIESGYIRQQCRQATSLDQIMDHFESAADATYSVAWIDCLARGRTLGRSLLLVGEHARPEDLPVDLRARALAIPVRPSRRVPADFPGIAMNHFSVKAFNEIYFRAHRRHQEIIDYDRFFYPLDALLDWNRLYGRSGFLQYQCVLPKAASASGLRALLERITATQAGSFLAVLKLFGPQDGLLSFPMEGYSLALDFRATAESFNLMLALDAIVRDHGGRLYLAKDARCGAAMMRQGYPNLDRFQKIRGAAGGQFRKFSSLLSQRVGL